MTQRSGRPAIVMIHGFRGTHHGLQLIAKRVKDDFSHVYVPDLPGFSKGSGLEAYTLDTYVTWLHHYIKSLQLKTPPVLLGHSFGTVICAAYAKKYPDTIQSLILANPISESPLKGSRKVMTKLTQLYFWIGSKLPTVPGRAWLSSPIIVQIMSSSMATTKDPSLRRFIHRQHHLYFNRYHSPKELNQIYQISISHTVGEFATGLTMPTLIIAGEKDEIAPLDSQYRLQAKVPNAQLVVIAGVGHLTHYETPDVIGESVHFFINSR